MVFGFASLENQLTSRLLSQLAATVVALTSRLSQSVNVDASSDHINPDVARDSLAARLHPRIVFVLLDGIRAVLREDVARADDLVCRFADLIRRTAVAVDRGQHSAKEEIALLEQTWFLLSQCLPLDAVRSSIEASEEGQRRHLPAMLLVSVVEDVIQGLWLQGMPPAEIKVIFKAGKLNTRFILACEVDSCSKVDLKSVFTPARLARLEEDIKASGATVAVAELIGVSGTRVYFDVLNSGAV